MNIFSEKVKRNRVNRAEFSIRNSTYVSIGERDKKTSLPCYWSQTFLVENIIPYRVFMIYNNILNWVRFRKAIF